jgi:hypothetical protein
MAAPLNYTTNIPADRTIAECQRLLGTHGAASVALHYSEGRTDGMSFVLSTPHGDRAFRLPVDVPAMLRLLVAARESGKLRSHGKGGVAALTTYEHAERVAWRVVKDWLEAQLALIDAQMATLTQVMLPYLQVDETRTLFEAYAERELAATEAIEP